ncbi:MAG: WYL domain-containing protein [Methanobrevibacter sp.]|nr:WYL domain-containing protein [Methanobrevibacter sp.]
MLDVLDSEIVFQLLQAINENHLIEISVRGRKLTVLPLKIYIGTQSGRQYILAWMKENDTFSFQRLDLIDKVKVLDTGEIIEVPINREEDFRSHIWGVNGSNKETTSHIEMTVFVEPEEEYIVQRLMREKRCGTVERVDGTHWKYSADVYGVSEMLPWLRTFIGRVTDLICSDEKVTERFWGDIDDLLETYGGEGNAVS